MKIIENGNINNPIGYKTIGGHIGLKKSKKDMSLITSDIPADAAGCFTTNLVKAAPVLWDIDNISNKIKGIVVNSGNANACTGEQGLKDTANTAELLANLENVSAENILVASTGVIGVNLPMPTLLEGVKKLHPQLNAQHENGNLAAEAIMTTDTFPKTVAASVELDGKTVTIGGMAKGSGMINPNMATMLAFLTTDANISRELLDTALKECIADTFNMICVDGDTSTNDSVIILANGLAENEKIAQKDNNYEIFKEALLYVNKTLAMSCAKDGEGATKFMEVTVNGTKTKTDAALMARSVVSSNLFKAALFGEDLNWGRALCAIGYSGADFNPSNVSMTFKSENGEILVINSGTPIVFDENLASLILSAHDIYVNITLNEGTSTATAWGCDLSYEYVKINGDYRS